MCSIETTRRVDADGTPVVVKRDCQKCDCADSRMSGNHLVSVKTGVCRRCNGQIQAPQDL